MLSNYKLSYNICIFMKYIRKKDYEKYEYIHLTSYNFASQIMF